MIIRKSVKWTPITYYDFKRKNKLGDKTKDSIMTIRLYPVHSYMYLTGFYVLHEGKSDKYLYHAS